MNRPTVAVTMGDPAGIGPEIVARALAERKLREACNPLVVGDPRLMFRAMELVRGGRPFEPVIPGAPPGLKPGILPDVPARLEEISPELADELARAMGAGLVIGTDAIPERLELARSLGLCDFVLAAGARNVEEVRRLTGGAGVERSFDCSANAEARLTAIQATRRWGRICFLGEGGGVAFQPSPDVIHDQKTIYGSWVTSIWRMEELVERLVRWGLHPERLITHRFTLDRAADAYALMASGRCGKVAVVFDEELR